MKFKQLLQSLWTFIISFFTFFGKKQGEEKKHFFGIEDVFTDAHEQNVADKDGRYVKYKHGVNIPYVKKYDESGYLTNHITKENPYKNKTYSYFKDGEVIVNSVPSGQYMKSIKRMQGLKSYSYMLKKRLEFVAVRTKEITEMIKNMRTQMLNSSDNIPKDIHSHSDTVNIEDFYIK